MPFPYPHFLLRFLNPVSGKEIMDSICFLKMIGKECQVHQHSVAFLDTSHSIPLGCILLPLSETLFGLLLLYASMQRAFDCPIALIGSVIP